MVTDGGCFGQKLVEPRWKKREGVAIQGRDGWPHGVLGVFHNGKRERGRSLRVGRRDGQVVVGRKREKRKEEEKMEERGSLGINFE